MIEIYKQGTEVVLHNGGYNGFIISAQIQGSLVMYDISYYENGEYKHQWLMEFEFAAKKSEKIEIGLKDSE